MTKTNRRYLVAALCFVALAVLTSLLLSSPWGEGARELLNLTHVPWEKPSVFGAFHLSFLFICIALCVLAVIMGVQQGSRRTDAVTFGAGIFFFLMECYKQWYSFYVLNNEIYDFGVFPFQFCSLPLYLCLLIPILKEGIIKDALYRFLALYGTMGGCLVMGFPAWYDTAALCFHTMLWHTVMIALGVFILFSQGYGKRYLADMIPATVVFLTVTAAATLLNVCLYPFSQNSPNPLNLFYMSPHHSTYLLVVKDAWEALGWWAGMLTYLFLFVFVGATVVWLVAHLINLMRSRFLLKK